MSKPISQLPSTDVVYSCDLTALVQSGITYNTTIDAISCAMFNERDKMWDSTYTLIQGLSDGLKQISPVSGNWNSTYSTVSSCSAHWENAYTKSLSSDCWNNVYEQYYLTCDNNYDVYDTVLGSQNKKTIWDNTTAWVNNNCDRLTTSCLDTTYLNIVGVSGCTVGNTVYFNGGLCVDNANGGSGNIYAATNICAGRCINAGECVTVNNHISAGGNISTNTNYFSSGSNLTQLFAPFSSTINPSYITLSGAPISYTENIQYVIDKANPIPVSTDSSATGTYAIVAGRSLTADGCYSLAFGHNNCVTGDCSIALGTGLYSTAPCYTFVNNISSQGLIAADGGSSINWNDAYNTSLSSACWNNAYDASLSSTCWNSTYTTVQNNSSVWDTSVLTIFKQVSGVTVPNLPRIVLGLAVNQPFTTDIDVALIAKGTGATLAQIPDNTIVGGNKRGEYATDWQKCRGNSAEVASGCWSTIGGGICNTAPAEYGPTVGGGIRNTASGDYSTVGGGNGNVASCDAAVVGGGGYNIANNSSATVGGGQFNTACGTNSTVGGGECNIAFGNYSTIGGGNFNKACAPLSFIAGGCCNKTQLANTFLLGSSLTASAINYTYVNNISSQGLVVATGGCSTNWNSAYTTVNTNSASWGTSTCMCYISAPGVYPWSPPYGAKLICVQMFGGGGGGGAGAKSTGILLPGQVLGGGGGGGGGGYAHMLMTVDMFYQTVCPNGCNYVNVYVGHGGCGGTGRTSNGDGNIGNYGETSCFGPFLSARGGGPGVGGDNAGTVSCGGAGGSYGGGAGASSAPVLTCNGGIGCNAYPTSVNDTQITYSLGGGGGGSMDFSGFVYRGGNGGYQNMLNLVGGAGGVLGTAPCAGVNNCYNTIIGGSGGGGSGARICSHVCAGGNGGWPAGGGGGGGASREGTCCSGNGGCGADGVVMIISYF